MIRFHVFFYPINNYMKIDIAKNESISTRAAKTQ